MTGAIRILGIDLANFASTGVSKTRQFYRDIPGLEVVMDLDWVMTFASPT